MPGKQPCVLEQKPHIRLERLHLSAADGNRPDARSIEPGDEAQKRGLAAAGAPDDRQQLPCGNGQI